MLNAFQFDIHGRYYGDIDFGEVAYGQSTKRVRQHTNPLRRELQVPAPAPVWADVYTTPSLPLVLDIGCGYGRFLIALATQWPDHNMLGLDIRQPLTERGNKWVSRVCPGKAYFQFANATVSLDSVLAGYPGELDLVTIQVGKKFSIRVQKVIVVLRHHGYHNCHHHHQVLLDAAPLC